jgi:hypothetical protein
MSEIMYGDVSSGAEPDGDLTSLSHLLGLKCCLHISGRVLQNRQGTSGTAVLVNTL